MAVKRVRLTYQCGHQSLEPITPHKTPEAAQQAADRLPCIDCLAAEVRGKGGPVAGAAPRQAPGAPVPVAAGTLVRPGDVVIITHHPAGPLVVGLPGRVEQIHGDALTVTFWLAQHPEPAHHERLRTHQVRKAAAHELLKLASRFRSLGGTFEVLGRVAPIDPADPAAPSSFPRGIRLGVHWDKAGFTGGSYIDQDSSEAVTHIQLLEPLTVGRLKRATGQLLCRTDAEANKLVTGAELAPDTLVDCARCLELASRLSQEDPHHV